MDRKHFDDDHLAFADAFRAFVDKEIVAALPRVGARRASRPREVFTAAGRSGFLGMAVPEQYGGGGVDDFRFNQVLDEQIALRRHRRHRASGISCTTTSACPTSSATAPTSRSSAGCPASRPAS